jgi:hypothetical protein
MRIVNLFVVSALIILLAEVSGRAQQPCKEIKATVEVKNTTAGQSDGSVTITIDGNSKDFRVFLIAPRSEDNKLELPIQELKNLSEGNYELVITESRAGEFCPKHIKIAIK